MDHQYGQRSQRIGMIVVLDISFPLAYLTSYHGTRRHKHHFSDVSGVKYVISRVESYAVYILRGWWAFYNFYCLFIYLWLPLGKSQLPPWTATAVTTSTPKPSSIIQLAIPTTSCNTKCDWVRNKSKHSSRKRRDSIKVSCMNQHSTHSLIVNLIISLT